jgi:hypothetical protein
MGTLGQPPQPLQRPLLCPTQGQQPGRQLGLTLQRVVFGRAAGQGFLISFLATLQPVQLDWQ